MKKLMMILCTILCANILAAQRFTSGGLKYEVISWYYGVRVTQQNSSAISGSVVIPSTVTYIGTTYNVTSIGDSAFYGCSGLTSVTIPNSVTSIGKNAFYGCRRLTSITIPNAVTSIGKRAFEGCSGLTTLNFNAINCQNFSSYYSDNPFNGTSLTTVNIGDSVQRIPIYFVIGCSRLTSITIPNSVTFIGGSAFSGCSSLTSVTIPNSVTSIGPSAFEGCSSLTSVTISNSVPHIHDFVFKGCSGLTSVTIPYSVTSIGEQAFYNCSGLTSVNMSNVTSIGPYAFYGCSGLTSVRLPYSVTYIRGSAFYGCSGLTSVTIPNSVTYIGRNAFYGCYGLTSINVASGNTHYSSIDGVLYNYVQDTLIQCPGAKTSVILPNSLTSIGSCAFYGCRDLTSVSIPNSVTSIGWSAFSGCSGLTSVTIGNRVTSIGDRAFYECLNLSSLISSAIVPPTIGNEAFPYPNICTVTVPCGSLEAYTASTCHWSVYFPQRITESSSFELSVSANEEAYGRVEVETQSCNVKTLTAIANEGYEFTAWNDGNTENPRTVTVTSDTTFMAIFAEAVSTPTITVTVNDATMGSATYTLDGNTAVLTATPNEGYSFLTWSDGNTENPRTVSITSDTTFMAIFAETETAPTITVTVNDAMMGSATYTMDGNTAVLTATANEGYRFLTWNDGNMENPRTVTVTSDTTFMAIFTASGSSSLQEVNAREFALYPNPAKSFVTLEFEALQENTLLQILDINGRRVRTLDLKAGIETLRIDLGDLPKGVYTIMLGNVTKKLIVE